MPRITVVEDQMLLAQVMSRLLSEQGYAVQCYGDGLEGYLGIVRDPPDLLVLDVLLPSLQGLALARLLKFSEEWAGIPILVISSVSENIEDVLRSVKADAFLPKPFEADVFLEEVSRLLAMATSEAVSERRDASEGAASPPGLVATEAPGSSVDLLWAIKPGGPPAVEERHGDEGSHAIRGGDGLARVRYLRGKPH